MKQLLLRERRVQGALAGYKPAAFLVVLVIAALWFHLFAITSLVSAFIQEGVLAVLGLTSVALINPSVFKRPWVHMSGWGLWVLCVLVVGVAGGVISWLMVGHPQASFTESDTWLACLFTLGLCAFTALFEEAVFRVIALDALCIRLSPLPAALVAAFFFGVMHLSLAQANAQGVLIVWAETMLKALEGGIFGFFMALLYFKTRNIWLLSSVHAIYDAAYFGLLLVGTRMLPTYVTGNVFDLALLAGSSVALMVPVMGLYRHARLEGYLRHSKDTKEDT